jgi:HSP20 family protein
MLPIKYTSFSPSVFFDRDEFLMPFSNLFDEFFNESFDFLGKDFFDKGSYPKVDVRDEETQIVIEAEIPGLTKEQVSVELDNGVLKIKGEKKIVDDKKSKTYVHKELKHSSFCRSFSVGNNVNIDNLTAKFENGILEIVLPKKVIEPKKEEVKKIDIK